MANTRVFHRSFAGGEIAPEMLGRIDADRYQTGAARVRNMVSKPQGPVQSRPGLEFVREVKDSTKKIRLIPFRYSAGQTYAVELGAGYIRLHQNGATLDNIGQSYPAYKASKDLLSVNLGTNVITLTAAHSFVTGDPIRFTVQTAGTNVLPSPLGVGVTYYVRVVSSTEISVATTAAKAQTVLAADLIRLYTTGSNLSGCKAHYRYTAGEVVTHTPPAGTLGTYSCGINLPMLHVELSPQQALGGSPWYRMPADNTYEIGFGATEAMLQDIHYVQSNDVLTLVHPSLAPCELRRYGDRKWVVETINFQPSCAAPTDAAVVARYGERFAIGSWRSSATSSVPIRATFAQRLPLAAGDVLWVTETKCRLLDDKRWIIYGDTDTGGSSISTGLFCLLQDYETGAQLTLSTALPIGTMVNSGGHLLVQTPSAHGLEYGAAVGFVAPPPFAGTIAGLTQWPTAVYYAVPIGDTTFKLSATPPAAVPTYIAFTISNAIATELVIVGGIAQSVSQISSLDNSYKITAVHADLSESDPTAELLVRNNIFSYGAFNSMTWRYFVGAPSNFVEYKEPAGFNVYKKDVGAYGLIGYVKKFPAETAQVVVSYNQTVRVSWPGHPLQDNDAISFSEIAGGGTLSGVAVNLIYYVKRITSGPYAGQFTLLGVPDGVEITYPTVIADVTCLARREYCFRDDNIAVDLGQPIPERDNAFSASNTYPASVSYFEQRRAFAGSNTLPQNVWLTKSGTESDLSYGLPTASDDRIAFRMAAREAFRIQHLVPMSSLLLLTESGEWRVTSIDSDALTPTSISVRPQSYIGSNNVQPATVNNIVLFASSRGGHLREMGYSNDQQSYVTGDLSLRAAHLFDDYALVDIGVAKAPVPVVWCVSSSGKLLGLTYIPEERITGWHWHDTDGSFETLCVVQEGDEDRVYACVKRTVGGVDKRYIERMAPMKIQALADTRYVDSWVDYVGAPSTTVSGLAHLNGKTVSILADGKVHPQKVVAGGAVTLDYAASNVVVGLPYTAELHTLPATMQIEGFGTGRTKNVGRSWIRVYESPGFEIGTESSGLTPSASYADSQNLASGLVEVTLPPAWTQDGQVILQQDNPVPLTIVGMTFEVSVGG